MLCRTETQVQGLFTLFALVYTVECDIVALLRQANECEEHVELVPSESSGVLPWLCHNLQNPGLCVARDPAVAQELLRALDADAVACTIAGVQQGIERINVRVRHVRSRKERLHEGAAASFLGRRKTPRRIVAFSFICEQAVARLARGLRIVIEERRLGLRARRQVVVSKQRHCGYVNSLTIDVNMLQHQRPTSDDVLRQFRRYVVNATMHGAIHDVQQYEAPLGPSSRYSALA